VPEDEPHHLNLSHPELNCLTFKEIAQKNIKINDLMEIGMFVDSDNLLYSLNKWILGIAKNSARNKDIFMKRLGMSGSPKMTYRKIAEEYKGIKGQILIFIFYLDMIYSF